MRLHPKYIVDEKGKKKSVILSLKEYKELLELVQDVIDTKLIEEVKNEPTVSWEEFKESNKLRHTKEAKKHR